MAKPHTVAIVNGIVRMKRYNAHLKSLYENIGFQCEEYQFNPAINFCCHLHRTFLDRQCAKILDKHDHIHCQSSGFFRMLPYAWERGILARKSFVLESPVLKSHTGTLYAALNWSKSYKTTPQNPLVNAFLDTVCFTPSYVENTLRVLEESRNAGYVMSMTSLADGVCDIEGYEDTHLDHIFEKGKHARLFAPDANENEFALVEQFIKKRQKEIQALAQEK